MKNRKHPKENKKKHPKRPVHSILTTPHHSQLPPLSSPDFTQAVSLRRASTGGTQQEVTCRWKRMAQRVEVDFIPAGFFERSCLF